MPTPHDGPETTLGPGHMLVGDFTAEAQAAPVPITGATSDKVAPSSRV